MLELLEIAKDFEINKKITEDGAEEYYVKGDDIVGVIRDDEITYYLSGCYNSGCDLMKIDVKELKHIQDFFQLLDIVEK